MADVAMTTSIPNRKACDRCHDHKLGCRRADKGPCERCLKANLPCTSSPSLRYRRKGNCRGRESGSKRRLLHLRPGPLKATGEILLLPQEDRLLCDLVSQLEQDPATSNPFGEPQVIKQMANILSPCSLGSDSAASQSEEVYKFHNIRYSNLGDSGGLRPRPFAAEGELGYPELCPPYSSLNYNQFQDTNCSEYVKQTLLEYLSEVNLLHDAWQALEQDTTCSGTNAGSWGLKMVDDMSPSGPCIQELFHLSQRFSSTLHAMVSTGMFAPCHMDPAITVLVYSRIQDTHDIIIQLVTKSLLLSRDSMVRITNSSRLNI
ncbi:hypothetical protein GGR58DRAFT_503798 [Xylaria digitata]|nr:hypothetical protein GGR58DRAFT_503798 [Xylaria digitata]